jgi:hypothetical protein
MPVGCWRGGEGGVQPGASLGRLLFSNWSPLRLKLSEVSIEFRPLDNAIELLDEGCGR